jgi:hypothetical protein
LKKATISEDGVDWSKVDRKTFDLLTERIVEYRDACKFLNEKIGDRKKAMSFLDIAEQF